MSTRRGSIVSGNIFFFAAPVIPVFRWTVSLSRYLVHSTGESRNWLSNLGGDVPLGAGTVGLLTKTYSITFYFYYILDLLL